MLPFPGTGEPGTVSGRPSLLSSGLCPEVSTGPERRRRAGWQQQQGPVETRLALSCVTCLGRRVSRGGPGFSGHWGETAAWPRTSRRETRVKDHGKGQIGRGGSDLPCPGRREAPRWAALAPGAGHLGERTVGRAQGRAQRQQSSQAAHTVIRGLPQRPRLLLPKPFIQESLSALASLGAAWPGPRQCTELGLSRPCACLWRFQQGKEERGEEWGERRRGAP